MKRLWCALTGHRWVRSAYADHRLVHLGTGEYVGWESVCSRCGQGRNDPCALCGEPKDYPGQHSRHVTTDGQIIETPGGRMQ